MTGVELMDANLLKGSYNNPQCAANVASSIQKSMELAVPNIEDAFAESSKNSKRSGRYRVYGNRNDFSKINLQNNSPQPWRISFRNDECDFEELSPQAAKDLVAKKMLALEDGGLFFKGTWGEFWNDIKQGFAQAVEIVVDFVEDVVQATIEFIVDGVCYLYNATLEFIQQAVDLVEGILKELGAFFKEVYDWLKFIFDWDSILLTQKPIKHPFNEFFDLAAFFLLYTKHVIDDEFEKLEGNIKDYFDDIIKNYKVGDDTMLGAFDDTPETVGYNEGMNNNIVMSAYSDHSKQAPIVDISSTKSYLSLKSTGENILQRLKPIAENFENNEEVKNLIKSFEDLANNLIDQPDDMLLLVLNDLLEIVKSVAVLSLQTINLILDVIIEAFVDLLERFKEMVNADLNNKFPFIAGLVKKLTGLETLSPLDIFSLILAVPTTIIYKISYEKAPFENQESLDQFITAFTAENIIAKSGLEASSQQGLAIKNELLIYEEENPDFLPNLLITTNAAAYFFFGFTGGVTDLEPIDSPDTEFIFNASLSNIIMELGTIGLSTPWIYNDYKKPLSSSEELSITTWGLLFVPFLFDVGSLVSVRKKISLIDDWGSIISFGSGLAFLGLYIAIAVRQKQEDSYSRIGTAANMLSVMPSIFQIFRAPPLQINPIAGTILRGATAIVDFGCNLTAGILYAVDYSPSNDLETSLMIENQDKKAVAL